MNKNSYSVPFSSDDSRKSEDSIELPVFLMTMKMHFSFSNAKAFTIYLDIIYQIYCTQIKGHLFGCLNSPSWAAVQRQRAANLLLVLVAKKPSQSREPPDLSRPLSLDQGQIEIVLQFMVHVCPRLHQLLEISH